MVKDKENPGLMGSLVEFCSSGGLLGMCSKSKQCPISVKNGKTYEYISMNNIQLV